MLTQAGEKEATDLYYDLLKKSLTNTLFGREPDADNASEIRFIHEFTNHYIKSPAVSMLPRVRLDHLQRCVTEILGDGVPGDLIETGAWRGGATIFMRAMLKVNGVSDRLVWVADSFDGFPEPDAERFPSEAKHFAGAVMTKTLNHLAVSLDEVRRNFEVYGMLDDGVRFLKGWFKDTLPSAPIERLAILRLDGDYYESTWDSLSALYDKLSVGGYVIVDDYGEDRWTYCAKAVDTFRAQRGIEKPLQFVDTKCCYWRRER